MGVHHTSIVKTSLYHLVCRVFNSKVEKILMVLLSIEEGVEVMEQLCKVGVTRSMPVRRGPVTPSL